MAQHDYIISNATFPAVRTDINNALSAIQTTNSGTSRPTGAVAGQLWLDTTTATSPTLKYYDGADDISLATIDHSANTVNWLDSTVSVTGLTTTATGTVLTLSDSANTSTVNLIIDNDKEIRFREATANGTNYISLSAPASLSADVTYTLPVAPTANNQALISSTAGAMSFTPYSLPASDGTANQILQTNGSGVISFVTPSGAVFSGATDNAISTSSLTLTSASTQYQRVQINSSTNNFVTLPSATTLNTKGNPIFVIENASPNSFGLDIKNNGGTIIGTIPIGYTAYISLLDNSTTNGNWQFAINNNSAIVDISSTVNTHTFTNFNNPKIIHLTATKLLAVSFTSDAVSTSTLYTKIGDISGSTITFGSEQTTTLVNASSNVNNTKYDVVRLSDSAFILLWGNATDTFTSIRRVSVNTVSGTTVTFGTQNALSFATGGTDANGAFAAMTNGQCCRMSDTKFAVVYNTTVVGSATSSAMAYSGSLGCNIITVSGTTLTVGTRVDLGSSTFTQPTTLVCHDTDRLCVVYYQHTSATNSTGRNKVNIISVSGTTPTWGTSVNVESADKTDIVSNANTQSNVRSTSLNNMYGIALSTTSVVGWGGGGGTNNVNNATGYILISISGTTPTITATKNLFNLVNIIGSVNVPILPINSTTFYQPIDNHTTRNQLGLYIYVTSSGFRCSALPTFEGQVQYQFGNKTLPSANSPNGSYEIFAATIRGTSASTNITAYSTRLSPQNIAIGTLLP